MPLQSKPLPLALVCDLTSSYLQIFNTCWIVVERQ